MTDGLLVLVQLVMAAITTEPTTQGIFELRACSHEPQDNLGVGFSLEVGIFGHTGFVKKSEDRFMILRILKFVQLQRWCNQTIFCNVDSLSIIVKSFRFQIL